MTEAIAGAVEFQHGGTPHYHAMVFLVNCYQHMTMMEIARRISENLLDPAAILRFVAQVCRETNFDRALHTQALPGLEKEWPRYEDTRHNGLSRVPQFLHEDARTTSRLWSAPARQSAKRRRT
jgi:hypothetical protein